MKEMVGGCCVCSDERGWPDNPLVYCDGNGCTVAVHQACYGIVTVPTGPWYCRKCESPETSKGKVRCELCPSRSGALKKADTGGWAHVVCALYIPEVRFGNVTSMEPIVLRLIPPERFTRTCYICTENGKAHRASQGACMACNKSGCKQQFHVTCAQSLGLLCEEAGNYLDNVKYCGYCQHHYSKLFTNHEVTVIAKKKGGNVKTIPPYKPVAHDSQSSESSSEKEEGASPMPGGSGTPSPHTKGSKGPGRKSSQNRDSSKNLHASKAAPPITPQPMDKKKSPSRRQSSTGDGPSTSKTSTPAPSPSHSADLGHSSKDKKSPSRRHSSTGDGPSSSKTSTPAPSPSHSADLGHSSKASGSSSERGRESSASRSTPPSASPGASKSPQTSGGVISSVASATAASTAPVPATSSSITTSVVQSPSTKLSSVITNTDALETKHTKKRKAAAAAASAAAEQAAQPNANGSPGRQSAASVELESRNSKKRRTTAVAAAPTAAPTAPTADDAQTTASKLQKSVAVKAKYNEKRKASSAASATVADAEKKLQTSLSKLQKSVAVKAKYNEKCKVSSAASATVADAEKKLQTSRSESPSRATRSTVCHEETKHTKKRKAAAAEKEKQPDAGACDGTLRHKSRVSAMSPLLISNSPSRVLATTENHEEKHTKKRKAVTAAADRETQPVGIVSEGKISQKESPSRASANTEAEARHTKKRKAASAESATAEATERAAQVIAAGDPQPGTSGTQWEHSLSSSDAPVPMDAAEKIVKKAKTDSNTPPPAHYLSPPPPPPPPPPPMRSPRHLTSPMPGPSSMNPPALMNPPSTIRSPSQHQTGISLESRPLATSASVAQVAQGSTDMPAPPSPHVFHQPQKPATMDSGIPAQSPHAHSQRSNWGGLNVAYELHSDPSKPSVSGNPSSAKDHSGIPMPPQPMPPMIPAMRNKKRAAMANPPLPPPQSAIQMPSTSSQSLAGVRRYASLPLPQPMYQETVMESPPVSPNAERHLKAKAEQQYYSRMLATAPHMLGNELNPDSGAAARLQEQLNAELAAHAVGGAGPDPVVPPPLINRAAPGSSGRSSGAQSLDQLLERQWEQGSQFLMEQAQHFDIASLLSCLHQLRTENVRLEEHVSNLLQRRDHLLAVNARLAIQLNSGGVTDASYQLTFQAAASAEPPRCSRDNGPPSRPAALEQPRCSRGDSGPPIRPPPPPARPAEAGSLERDRHTERAQVAQQVSHQMLMREVQQKPS